MSETTKVVINECFGGFGLSAAARAAMRTLGWSPADKWDTGRRIERDDPRLVHVVETLGTEASEQHAHLVVAEIPADVKWHVHEYDGSETIHEEHRSWASDGIQDYCC